MTIKATVIADSISKQGKRLTTFQLRYPRWIHAEGRTHRQLRIGEAEWEPKTPSVMEDPNLSRNASSSRAVPVEKLIQDIIEDPAIPMFWGSNKKGMQAGEENSEPVLIPIINKFGEVLGEDLSNVDAWLEARNSAITFARAFAEAGYHKQIVNRLLEPFSHINVVVTATEWSNFFALRRHADAEPHIKYLADEMYTQMNLSVPEEILPGGWHLPYVSQNDKFVLGLENSIKLSVACCASVSYKTVDGDNMSIERATALYDRLVGAHPMHASPAEHIGTPDTLHDMLDDDVREWQLPHLHGNFVGWIQYRKTLTNECL